MIEVRKTAVFLDWFNSLRDARDAGITREALYKALSDKGDPKLSTLLGVMKAIGLRFTVAPKSEAA